MNNKQIITAVSVFIVALSLAVSIPVFAQENNDNPQGSAPMMYGNQRQEKRSMMTGVLDWLKNKKDSNSTTTDAQKKLKQERKNFGIKPDVVGKVTAISGNTITLTARQGFGSSTNAIIYTVDVSGATIMKKNATSTVSSILVGDNLLVQGTISGTNVTAKLVRDSAPNMMNGRENGFKNGTSTTPIGNGEPILAGKVSAIDGNNITIVTTTNNVSYSVDASNSKFLSGRNTITISDVAVGDMVVVQGTINGNSVTASTIFDQAKKDQNQDNSSNENKPKPQGQGFFSGVEQFFKHLFGF